MRELLVLVLVLACPLMMIWMMRGHVHGGDAHGTGDERGHRERGRWPESTSTAELRRQREVLDRLIEERRA